MFSNKETKFDVSDLASEKQLMLEEAVQKIKLVQEGMDPQRQNNISSFEMFGRLPVPVLNWIVCFEGWQVRREDCQFGSVLFSSTCIIIIMIITTIAAYFSLFN